MLRKIAVTALLATVVSAAPIAAWAQMSHSGHGAAAAQSQLPGTTGKINAVDPANRTMNLTAFIHQGNERSGRRAEMFVVRLRARAPSAAALMAA